MSFITMQTRQMSFNDIQLKTKVRYEQILYRLDKPKTAKEIAVELYELGVIPSTERNYVSPRLTELEKRGIVRTVGKKKCNYTGKTVAVYEKVDNLRDMIEDVVSNKNICVSDSIKQQQGFIIGTYKTEERAKKVLQEIIKAYQATEICYRGQVNYNPINAIHRPIYEMPEE